MDVKELQAAVADLENEIQRLSHKLDQLRAIVDTVATPDADATPDQRQSLTGDPYADLDLEPVSDREMRWIGAHFEELQQQFSGEWIAVIDDRVVAHGIELTDVDREVRSLGITDPFYEWIPPEGEEPPILIL